MAERPETTESFDTVRASCRATYEPSTGRIRITIHGMDLEDPAAWLEQRFPEFETAVQIDVRSAEDDGREGHYYTG